MKTNFYFSALLLLILLANFGDMVGQEKLFSEDLIGTWTYIGPQNTKLGDTIVLTKEPPHDSIYWKWIFQLKDNELLISGQQPLKKDDKTYTIAVASNGIKWSYKNEINRLIVNERSGDRYFDLISYQHHRIKFLRNK